MKSKSPFFSIVTCTYNSEKFIAENLDSVFKQKFKDYEHIFIDGNSKDESTKIIEQYKAKNLGKVEIYNTPPRGISNAFNCGISKSRGKWIIFLNSDDHLYDFKVLGDVHKFLQIHSDADWIYGKIAVIDSHGDGVGVFPERKIFQNSNDILLRILNYIPHQAVFMKHGLFDVYGGFDEGLTSSMDYDLYLRIADKTKKYFMDRTISNYRIGENSASSSLKNKMKNSINLSKVQKRYLNLVELTIAHVVNGIVERHNKIYAIQKYGNNY
jgi:glycosyltransferase involved in cell wall biosynthesis